MKALGHEVTFASNPYFKKYISDKNIHFYSIGVEEDFLRITLNNFRVNEGSVSFLNELVFNYLGALNQFIKEQKKNDQKIIIICNLVTIFIVDAVKELNEDIQIISAHLSPWSFYSLNSDDHLLVNSSYRNLTLEIRENLWNLFSKKKRNILPGINKVRGKFNLAPITNLHQYLTKKDRLHLALFPKWFAKKENDWPSNIFYGDFIFSRPRISIGIDKQLNDFISSGDKPILISQATLQERYVRTQDTYLYNLISNLSKKNKYRFIFSAQDLKDKSSDNPAIFHTGHINYEQVFPGIKLIAHHGGIGTIAHALRFGIPQLIYRGDIDQIYNAQLIEKLGVGFLMKETQPTEHEFLTYIEKLVIENTVKNRCESIKEKFMGALSPLQIADMINESV